MNAANHFGSTKARARRGRGLLGRAGLALAMGGLIVSEALFGATGAFGAQPSAPPDSVHIIVPQTHGWSAPPARRQNAVRVTRVRANVSIVDQVATTTLEMIISNPTGRPSEAQLVLPVPEGSSVARFVLEGAANEGVAKLLSREEARRIYEEIVRSTRDPGLVEFIGNSMVRTSVFPVPAGGQRTVHLTYETILPGDNGRVDYVLPRSESLRGDGPAWSAQVKIRSSRPITTVYSPTHDLATNRPAPGEAIVTVAERSLASPGSIRLSYVAERTQGDLSSMMLAYPDPTVGAGGGYFLMVLGAPPADAKVQRRGREVTLVLDRSGSMAGDKFTQARLAALQVIEGLTDADRFNIVDYSDSVASMAPAALPKNAESMQRARQYLNGLTTSGGTNIHDALLAALTPPAAPDVLPMVLFLTDGLPTVGQTGEQAIRDAIAKGNPSARRIFTFGVGVDVNAPLLTGVALAARGTSTFVLPGEDVEVKVGQVFKRLHGPVLSGTELTWAGERPVDDVLPRVLNDVFDGDQMVIVGRYLKPGPITATISGRSGTGAPASLTLSFDTSKATVQNAFVARLWATRKITFLNDNIRALGAQGVTQDDSRVKELIDEIVRLSTRFGVLTEYTAFLAKEDTPLASSDALLGLALAPAGRALNERAGAGAVAQDMNLERMRDAPAAPSTSVYYFVDSAGRQQRNEVLDVQMIADQALFRRDGRWVQASAAAKRQQRAPDVTVAFGTDAYFGLADRLQREGRLAMLAQDGDIELELDGKVYLVQGG